MQKDNIKVYFNPKNGKQNIKIILLLSTFLSPSYYLCSNEVINIHLKVAIKIFCKSKSTVFVFIEGFATFNS